MRVATDIRAVAVAGGCVLSTETRVQAVDDAARRAFRRYWRVVGPFSGLIRRRWLRAARPLADAHILRRSRPHGALPSDATDILDRCPCSSCSICLPLLPGATGRDSRGTLRERVDVPSPAGYAVFDCETTGTDVTEDEIVSLALIRLDRDGREKSRYTVLVRPSRPIPAEATAVHGISDGDVEQAPRFAQIAPELLALLGEAVFVAHNASFDLGMLRHAFGRESIEYRPGATACTLEAFRLLEPLADNHRLQTICDRRGVVLADAHDAMSDVLATTALLRVLLDEGIAPETVELDHNAYMRLRSRGDTRPASEPQIRRVFGLARSAGLVLPDGTADREQVVALVVQVTGVTDVDALTRAQVQDVYDALEELIEQQPALAPAASA